MYATLESLRLFGACTGGYSRVCRAVGGTKFGMQTPIPLWIGATTGWGLSDVEWILDRGFIINDGEFKALFKKIRPTLAIAVQHHARTHYADFFHMNWINVGAGTRRSMVENPESSLLLRTKTVMDAACDFTLLSKKEQDALIEFVKPLALATNRYNGFNHVRTALLAYGGKLEPLDLLRQLKNISMLTYDAADMKRPWFDVLIERYITWAEQFDTKLLTKPSTRISDDEDEDDEDEEDAPVARAPMRKTARSSRSKTLPKKDVPKLERPTKFDQLPLENKVVNATRHWRDYYQFRDEEHSGLGTCDESDMKAISAFLSHFNQKDFFSKMALTGERSFNGVMLPNDMNAHNDVDVLVRRQDDGTLDVAVFTTKDPVLARQIARMVRAAKLNVAKNTFTVGEESEDGSVTGVDVPTEEDEDIEEEEEAEDEAEDTVETPVTAAPSRASTALLRMRITDLTGSTSDEVLVTPEAATVNS